MRGCETTIDSRSVRCRNWRTQNSHIALPYPTQFATSPKHRCFPRLGKSFYFSRSYRGGNPTSSLNAPLSDWNVGFRGEGVGFRGPHPSILPILLNLHFYISHFSFIFQVLSIKPSGSRSPVALATFWVISI